MLKIFEDSCALRIGVLGMNFKTAPLELREKISKGVERLIGEKGLFFRFSSVVLSTCNRTEVYFSGEDLAYVHSEILRVFRLGVEGSFEHHFYSYFGIDCFAHLCKVTSGLDSAMLAETEIQRQVKVAYECAAKYGAFPPVLHYVFQKALKVGRETRNRLSSSFSSPSLFSMIWRLSKETFSDLSGVNILFVGFSELNRQLMTLFARKGAKKLTVCTRTPLELFSLEALVVGREILERWEDFPLIICATKANQYLLHGPGKPGRLIFDLSVPRCVDPSIGKISQLYNMEEINELMQALQQKLSASIEETEDWIRSMVIRLAQIYRDKVIRVVPDKLVLVP